MTREFDTEVTEQHPDERVAWKSIDGGTRNAGVVTFHRLDDTHTRLMIQIDWEPDGLVEKTGAVSESRTTGSRRTRSGSRRSLKAAGPRPGLGVEMSPPAERP